MLRISLLLALAASLSGCIVVPRVEVVDTLTFDVPPPEQVQLSYEDMLCCFDCSIRV